MTTVVVTPVRAAASVGHRDRLFYSGMAIVLALTVFAGFASTYYLRVFSGAPAATLSGAPMTTLLHVHGALFTTRVVLFIVQTALIASRRAAVHRRLGVAGAVLAAAMIVIGCLVAVATAKRGASVAGMGPLAFLAIPLFDMILFAGFIGTALARRRDKEAHKRLMLMAYISIVVAAVARLPGVIAMGPPGFFGLTLLFVVAAAIYDFVSRRRVHPVYVWGGLLLVLSIPARLAIANSAAWQSFAARLIR